MMINPLDDQKKKSGMDYSLIKRHDGFNDTYHNPECTEVEKLVKVVINLMKQIQKATFDCMDMNVVVSIIPWCILSFNAQAG